MKIEDRLYTFAHLGEFSTPEKELKTRILKKRKETEESVKREILRALADKEKETLEKYRGFYRVEYQRNTLAEKLFRSKKHPHIVLTQPLEVLMDKILGVAYFYQASLRGIKCALKRELREKMSLKQYEQKRLEKEKRFKGFPFQDNPDDAKAAINPEHICLVHVTKYFPQRNAKGQYELETLATATHLKFPRNTIHFALNHHVESHTAGGWDEMPYVVLAPMADVSRLNHQNPMGISAVDTFYEMDVGENLRLPESAFLIYPASPAIKFKENQYVKRGKSHAVYKTTFSPSEREELKTRFSSALKVRFPFSTESINLLPTEEQNKILSGLIKKDLVREQLHQMGYETNLNQGKETDSSSPLNKVSRLGKRLQTLFAANYALHSHTIFGHNGINDRFFAHSPDRLGVTIDFLYALTHLSGTLTKGEMDYTFVDDKKKEHACTKCDLECVFQDQAASDYLQKGLKSLQTQLKGKPSLLTPKSKKALDAWSAHQKKLWRQSAPPFFKMYPTLEQFDKAFKGEESVKIAPKASVFSTLSKTNEY
ncbi:MAG: hypothetical protein ACI4OR_01480 [Alphaproteobacteria bacterium]